MLTINDQRARDLARILRTEDIAVETLRVGDVLVLDYAIVQVAQVFVDTHYHWRDADDNGGGFMPGESIRILARDIFSTQPG